ncbi:MAG: MFS transporter [Bacteriovoracaceae bacterium]|jgi:MFS family permease|nr:MFS transporter [Bacteriovoracaceae bacterium]
MLTDKRFFGTFWTMFFGAFNDNVFKNALVILIVYKSYSLGTVNSEQMVALSSAIFILPFFLFSALAGQVSDKYSKTKLTRVIKALEIIIMIIGTFGFYFENIPVLLITLFLTGTQSTFYGPAKFSILPELVEENEITKANAYIEMGTFISILLGTIVGGTLIAIEENGAFITGIGTISFALIGYIVSLKIPHLSGASKDLKFSFNPVTTNISILKIIFKNKKTNLAAQSISWFWLIGAILLSIFPVYVKEYIKGTESITTFLLAIFSIGIAIGSLICERLSHEKVNLKLSKVGVFFLSLFSIDLYFCGNLSLDQDVSYTLMDFFVQDNSLRVFIDLLGVSMFSGLFIVPLYTLLQTASDKTVRARVIAGNNILNSFYIVVGSILLTMLYSYNFTVPQIFLVLGLSNFLISLIFIKKA